MGYTNKTSHYELPQYVANDKPSWLGDFNAAMLKIDTVMADNDATAEAANSAATGAQSQVAALSSQLTTIQGQVNTAIDTATTADGKATTAQTVAGNANTAASEAKTLAETAKQTADNALPIGGGTMTGPLVLSGAPTDDNGAATKNYVDSAVAAGGEERTALVPASGHQFGGIAYYTSKGIFIAGCHSGGQATNRLLFNIGGNPFGLALSTTISGARLVAPSAAGQSFGFSTDVELDFDGDNTRVRLSSTAARYQAIDFISLQYIKE